MRLLAFLSATDSPWNRHALLAAPAWGQDSPAQRATLKGVTIVEVVVEEMDRLPNGRLTRSQIGLMSNRACGSRHSGGAHLTGTCT